MDTNPLPTNKPKVLLIDDNETYRKITKNVLQIENFEVLEATNGQDAFDILKNNKPIVILTDVYMPVMDGMAFLQAIKKDPQLKDIPVIMITNVQEELDKAVTNGAEEALLKSSLTPKQTVDICRKYLAKE